MALDKAPQNESVEGPKLEWGADLGQMSWNDALKKITELNATLPEGEKPWRLPTEKELCDEFDYDEFRKTRSSSAVGFQDNYYWSDSLTPTNPFLVPILHMGNGVADYGGTGYANACARLVRNVA
ncbi:MAG: DUF1566 domain-containing protein [Candidatus Paceibacterota bacterium]